MNVNLGNMASFDKVPTKSVKGKGRKSEIIEQLRALRPGMSYQNIDLSSESPEEFQKKVSWISNRVSYVRKNDGLNLSVRRVPDKQQVSIYCESAESES